MSNYDENPFADPEAANPFADPSVRQNTWNQQQDAPGGLDDFNPFAEGNTQTKSSVPPPQPPPAASTGPAVMAATQDPPPPYSAAAAAGTDDLKRRQEELERKAAELQRKEQELQRNLGHQARVDNFPPLPDKCCVKPCFYQDFELDIPLEFQKIVKAVYYIWIAYVCILLLNMLGALAYFIVASRNTAVGSGSAGITFGVSILYVVLFTPCSFLCWYRPLYKAFRSDSSFNFFFFFFVFFFQFCVSVLHALGISGWGTVGILSSLDMFTVNKGCATFMLLIGILFGCLAVVTMAMLIKVHRLYRSTGASFAKAQEEFAQGVMTNKNVQQAASTAGQAAARQALSGDNRY